MRVCTLFVFVGLLGGGLADAQSLTGSLVSYFKMDNNGDFSDSTGSANGTVVTAPVGFTTDGRINGAATFTASGSMSDPRVRVALSGANSWTGGTIAAWVRPVVYSSGNGLTIAQISELSNWGHRWLYIDPATRKVVLHIGMGGGAAANIASGISINDNTWYFIVGTWDKTQNVANLYINGFPQGNVSVPTWGTTSNNFYWGSGFNGYGTNGTIDEVGVWSRALSSSEVSTLYGSGGGLSYPFVSYSLSGTVRDSGNNGVPNVTVNLSTGASTTTAANGTYSFSGLSNASYTVTPALGGYTFNPTSRNLTISGANATNADFTRSDPPTYSISGTILTAGGSAAADVPVFLSNGQVTYSSGSGTFLFANLSNGTYTVTPTQAGFEFAPSSRSIQIAGASVSGAGFTRSASCLPTLSPTSIDAPTAGQTVPVSLTISPGCAWAASENLSWVSIVSGSSGTGAGIITLQIDPNGSGSSRSGAVSIAGAQITIQQGSCGISPTSATFSSAAASSEVVISGSCTWNASTSASFLAISGASSGAAPGTVRYTVQAYSGGTNPRTGVIMIAGIPFTVTQNPQPACTFQLTPASTSLPAGGGSGRFQVSTANGCGWNASTVDNWITITAGANGGVDGAVSFQAAPNTGSQRSGTIAVAGQSFTVNQESGAGCPAVLDPPSATFESVGTGEAVIRVNSPCAWSAAAHSSFLSIVTGAAGSGPGTVTYRVQAASAARTGTLTVAGQTFNITQRAPVCEYALSNVAATIPATGGTVRILVYSTASCLETIAVQDQPSWLTTNLGNEGQGFRSASFTAPVNNGNERAAVVRVAGVNFTITQAAADAFSCRLREPATIPTVRSEGRTELVGELVLECSGQSASAVIADVLVTFNTNLTSRPFGSLSEALLLVNEPSSPQLGGSALQGVIAGNNAVRFPSVPLGIAGPNATRVFRMKNLRLDASLPALPADLTATVAAASPGRTVPVDTATRTVARRSAGVQMTVGSAVPINGGYRVPVTFQELIPTAFRTRDSEAGYTLSGVEQIGTADSGTRLVAKLRGLPAGTLLSAPLYPESGQGAQLVANDPSGAGIGLQTATGAGNPQIGIPVVAGEATITWEILSATETAETHTFNLTITDVTNLSSRLTASLGPFRQSAQNLNRQPVPGFADPAAAAVGAPRIRALNRNAAVVAPTSNALRRAPGTNRTVTLEVTVTCDAAEGCDDPTARGNTSAGTAFQSCVAEGAESCSGNGRDFTLDFPRLAQGQSVSAIIGTELLADAPGGSIFRYAVSASSGTRTAVSEAEQCLTSTGSFPNPPANGVQGQLEIFACGSWSLVSPAPWITFTPASGSGNGVISYQIASNNSGVFRSADIALPGGAVARIAQPPVNPEPVTGLRFVPVTPCRLLETRPVYAGITWTGAFGPPLLSAGQSRTLPIAGAARCGIPASAKAFVLNITLDTIEAGSGPVDFVTVYPAGQPRPSFWTARTTTGGYIANSAIVAAGTGGSVDIYASNNVNLLVDINGYFTDDANGLLFYPYGPCRGVDTRGAPYGTMAPPYGNSRMQGGETRALRLPGSPGCSGLPAATAYSLQMTLAPGAETNGNPVAYVTAWPEGQAQPPISNMNAFFGYAVANSGIVPASANGSINVFAYNPTNVILDVNGYFAPDDGSGRGLFYYPVTQCRAVNTQDGTLSGVYGGPQLTPATDRQIAIPGSPGCNGIPTTAKAFALNATAVPNGAGMPFLSMWPAGAPWPVVSQLNAFQGQTVANSGIVPAGANGTIQVKVAASTHAAIEVAGYFSR